jgi:outer membrane protein W
LGIFQDAVQLDIPDSSSMKSLLKFLILSLFAFGSSQATAQAVLGVEGNVVPVFGSAEDGIAGGAGGRVQLGYMLDPSNRISLRAGYWSMSKETVKDVTSPPPYPEYSLQYNIVPVTIGYDYFLTEGNFRPYISVEAGVAFNTLTVKDNLGGAIVTAFTTSSNFNQSPLKTSSTGFITGLGIGATYDLDESIFLDVSVKYFGIWGNPINYYDTSSSTATFNQAYRTANVTSLPISIGIGFKL